MDYDMEVVLLHAGDSAAVGPWCRSGARAVLIVAVQLLSEGGAEGCGQPEASPSRSAWRRQHRVLCLLAEVDLATGAGLATEGTMDRAGIACAAPGRSYHVGFTAACCI